MEEGALTPGGPVRQRAASRGYDVFLAVCNLLLAVPSRRVRLLVLRRLLGASIGAGTSIGRKVRIECKGGLRIADRCNVNARVLLDARGGLTIGALVNISPEAMLLSAEHDIRSPTFEGRSAPTVIESRSWIASRAVVLPGTVVGEGAVVGAGAVVRGRVEPWTVVVGNPARRVAERPSEAQAELAPYQRWLS